MCVMWGLGEGGYVCNVGGWRYVWAGIAGWEEPKSMYGGGVRKVACKHVQGGVGGGRVIDGL